MKPYSRLLMLGAAPEAAASPRSSRVLPRARLVQALADRVHRHPPTAARRATARSRSARCAASCSPGMAAAPSICTCARAVASCAMRHSAPSRSPPAAVARAPAGGGFERSHGGPLMRRLLEQAACVLIPCESLRSWVRSVARGTTRGLRAEPVSCDFTPPAPRSRLVLFLCRMEPARASSTCSTRSPRCGQRCGRAPGMRGRRQPHRGGAMPRASALPTPSSSPAGSALRASALLEAAAAFALPRTSAARRPARGDGGRRAAGRLRGRRNSGSGGRRRERLPGRARRPVEPRRALRRLLIDAKLAERIGAAARETAMRFAPERALPQLEEIYAALGVQALGAAPAAPVGARAA